MSQYVDKNGYAIELEPNQFVLAFPSGGGFRKRIPLQVFLSEFTLVTEVPSWRAAKFCIDGGNDYPGFHNQRRWNGWACPCFTHETVKQIAEDTNGPGTDWVLFYRADKNEWVFSSPDEDEADWEVWEEDVIVVDGQSIPVFHVGSGSWVWEVSRNKEES